MDIYNLTTIIVKFCYHKIGINTTVHNGLNISTKSIIDIKQIILKLDYMRTCL